MVDGEIKEVSLSDYSGKYVVLFWYPKVKRAGNAYSSRLRSAAEHHTSPALTHPTRPVPLYLLSARTSRSCAPRVRRQGGSCLAPRQHCTPRSRSTLPARPRAEIIAFSDRAKEFEKLNCQLIAASTDTEETHLAWIRTPRYRGGLVRATHLFSP